MAEQWPCPNCLKDVPSTGIATGVGSGPILAQPNTSHANCPHCGAPLVRVTTAPDPSWKIEEDRIAVTAYPPLERSTGLSDEHWQAIAFEGAVHETVNVIVTGSAVCTGEGVDEALVARFVKDKISAIPHRQGRTRVELLPDLRLELNSDYVVAAQDLGPG